MTLLLVCLASLCHRLIPPRTRQSPGERGGGVEWPSPIPRRYSLLINSVVSSVPRHGRGAWLGIFFRSPIGRQIREENERKRERENEYNIPFVIRYLCPEMNLEEEGRIFPCMHCSTMVNCEKRGSRRASDASNHLRSDETALCARD